MYQGIDITLYSTCFNSNPDGLKKMCDGVLSQTVRPGEIILHDDGSHSPVTSSSPQVIKVVRNDENVGLAASRNQVVAICKTPLIACLDSDVVPEPDWLEHLLAIINRENVTGVGGKLVEAYTDTVGDRWRSVHMAQHWGDEPVFDPRFLYGCNNLYKTDVLKEFSYNVALKTNYEDMSLSSILYENGNHLYYEPKALCRHLRRDSEVSILPGFWKWYHAKGLLEGQFHSPEGLLERIDAVNFGIFRYRYDLDVHNNRGELLPLDLLIPWVFCTLDLRFAHREAGLSVPAFPAHQLLSVLPDNLQELYEKIAGPCPQAVNQEEWHTDYLKAFEHCLSKWKWGA